MTESDQNVDPVRQYVRVEDAFLSVGADPQHPAIIHAYNHDPLIRALAYKLMECLEQLQQIDRTVR